MKRTQKHKTKQPVSEQQMDTKHTKIITRIEQPRSKKRQEAKPK